VSARLLVPFVLLVLFVQSSGWAEEKVETYPDGKKKRSYAVNAEGLKNGPYKEFHPNGKLSTQAVYRGDKLHGLLKHFDANGRLQSQENYRAGKLHGVRQEFAGGRMVKDEVWLDGELLVPRSAAILTAELKAIQSLPIQTVGETPRVNAKVRAAVEDTRLQGQREVALRVLMAYRCVCGVPYRDLALDRTYIAHTEAASDLLTRLNEMTHTPENPGMPDDEYRLGAKGAGSSNLFSAAGMVDAVKSFMDDSDARNIDRLGHRRWCLNPAMAKTGFGAGGKYTAMWSMDSSRSEAPDYGFVAFPPRGLTPTTSFHDRFAWSLSLNPKRFRPPSQEQVKVRVYPVRYQPGQGLLEKASQPLELNYFRVSLEGFGISNCIIFRPANFKVIPGGSYWVEITGLIDNSGQEAKIAYLVAFAAI